jgi:hypothetical protein
MGGYLLAVAIGAILPAMIEASNAIASHEAERQFHTTMGAAVLPDMGFAVPVPPDNIFNIVHPHADRCSRRNITRQRHGDWPDVTRAHVAFLDVERTTHAFRPQAARHFKHVDERGVAAQGNFNAR